MKRINLTNKRFGRLKVIKDSGLRSHRKIKWKCICDCGNITYPLSIDLIHGKTFSCGCLRTENTINRSTKHGFAQAGNCKPEYNSWAAAKQRCYNLKRKAFINYGGRGIAMCRRWRNSFENFLKDMGLKPGPSYSIDRIDNNGPYGPWNCQWATKSQQRNNQRGTNDRRS